MCGIAGIINTKDNIVSESPIIDQMINTLKYRGPDSSGKYTHENAILGHRRLIVVDPKGGDQPMTRYLGNRKYTIVYNGELYNTEEVRKVLKNKGYNFESYSDTEVLLTSYIEWGEECLNHINGIFAFCIWDEYNKTAFLARDPLGVKPLFYSIYGSSLIFASEIKAILTHPSIRPIIKEQGLLEIFGLGPSRGLGNGIFNNIKEIKPAYFMTFNSHNHTLKEYWKLSAKPHKEDFDTTLEHTRNLLVDAIERQLVSDVPVCTFLSGGLDSSIISTIASKYFEKANKKLKTFSVDYMDNEKHFKSNIYEPNSDSYYINKMVDFIKSNHSNIVLSQEELADSLEESVIARDLPGMADVDSSLYLFCKEIKKHATVALSGECADEIFGGYPWYTREEDLNIPTFPWSKTVNLRNKILNNDLQALPLNEYVQSNYYDTLKDVPKLDNESAYDSRIREMFYLNIKWFMVTLLNRKDRMSMRTSLEVRVPFADYRLVEYAYNIPANIKLYKGREKGLLREALLGLMPENIIFRKKSPYPKTHNPIYTSLVQKKMRDILNNSNSPILEIINYNYVKELVKSQGKAFNTPWFGQLMTGPQVIALLIQINFWLEHYNVEIKI